MERLKALLRNGLRCSVKNRKTCGLFDPQKGFLLFAVYHLGKILSISVKMDQESAKINNKSHSLGKFFCSPGFVFSVAIKRDIWYHKDSKDNDVI